MKMYNLKKYKEKIKYINIILFIIMIFNLLPITSTYAVIRTNLPVSSISDTFPNSYKPYIDSLKAKYPNWIFKAVYTNLDWAQSVNHETYISGAAGISTIHDSYGSEWKKDAANNYIDGPYVQASVRAVEYVLDPRNSLTEDRVFQFENLNYSQNVHTIEAVQKVLLNTPMGNEKANQYKNNNNWITMSKTYSQIIYDVAKNINMSPVHLASRIKQENSGDIVNKPTINGSYPGYEGYYNFCNINAVPGANGNSAVTNALIHAKNSGWTNPELSISGCASTIFNKYIYWGQNTIYFQKFDVNNPGQATVLYGSQYMTNIVAPINESKISYDAYNAASMINMPFEFHIPVYNNMPSTAAPYPYTNDVYYQQDYTKVYLDDPNDSGVNDVFSLRATPSSNALTLKTLTFNDGNKTNNTSDYIITRIEKGIGTQWDKIRVKVKSTGEVIDGYMFQEYVYNLNYTKVDSITLDKTDININVNGTAKLNATINPSDAWYKDYSYASSNSNIVTVDSNGNLVAKSLGNAIITVTTEDQNKSFSCNITVSNAVQSINLDKSSYKVLKDNYLVIVPNVLPDNATNKNYTIVSSNENIVKVEDKRLKGINLGTANVTFKTVENNKEVTVPVEVIDQGSFNVSVDNSLKLENSYMSKVNPSTKVTDIKAKINTNLNIEVRNKSNIVLTDDSGVGTGTNINMLDTNNNVVLTYTIIIYGDIDGDGNIKSTDYVKIKNHIMEVSSIKSIELISGDVNRDGRISSSDYVLIKNSIMNDNASIVQ